MSWTQYLIKFSPVLAKTPRLLFHIRISIDEQNQINCDSTTTATLLAFFFFFFLIFQCKLHLCHDMRPSCISAATCLWWLAAASEILLWAAAVTSLLNTPCDLQFITFIHSQTVFLLSTAWVLHIYRIESQHPEWYLLTAVVLKAVIKETPCVTCVRKVPRGNRCIRWIGSGVSRDAYGLLRRIRLPHAFLPGLLCLCTEMFNVASQNTAMFTLFFFIDFWFDVINTQQIYFLTSSTNWHM